MHRSCLGIFAALVLCSGCTEMPAQYTPGDPKLWPRWGYRVVAETPEHLDLEVIAMQYAFLCTAAHGQLELARDLFKQCASRYATFKGRKVGEMPDVSITTSHIRNGHDGTCSMRASMRVPWEEAPGVSGPSPAAPPPPPQKRKPLLKKI